MWFFEPRTIIAVGFSPSISKPRTTTNTSYGISKPTTTYITIFSLAKTPLATSPPSLTRIIKSTTIRFDHLLDEPPTQNKKLEYNTKKMKTK